MFANLKNKLIEEVKASPSKFQQFAVIENKIRKELGDKPFLSIFTVLTSNTLSNKFVP